MNLELGAKLVAGPCRAITSNECSWHAAESTTNGFHLVMATFDVAPG